MLTYAQVAQHARATVRQYAAHMLMYADVC
jgi:hypothetical protein